MNKENKIGHSLMYGHVLVSKDIGQVCYNYVVDRNSSNLIVFVRGDLGVVSVVFSKSMFSYLEEVQYNQKKIVRCGFASISESMLFKNKLKEVAYGVFNGYVMDMYFKGLGYRGWVEHGCLYVNIGYTHIVKFDLPLGIIAKCRKNHLLLFGVDKERLNDVAQNLMKVKVADPYRGKGIRYVDREFVLKVGKTR